MQGLSGYLNRDLEPSFCFTEGVSTAVVRFAGGKYVPDSGGSDNKHFWSDYLSGKNSTPSRMKLCVGLNKISLAKNKRLTTDKTMDEDGMHEKLHYHAEYHISQEWLAKVCNDYIGA
jgi:hypothetical protein